MEGKTPQKAKGQQLAGGEGLSLAVVQFGQASVQTKSSANPSPVVRRNHHSTAPQRTQPERAVEVVLFGGEVEVGHGGPPVILSRRGA